MSGTKVVWSPSAGHRRAATDLAATLAFLAP